MADLRRRERGREREKALKLENPAAKEREWLKGIGYHRKV